MAQKIDLYSTLLSPKQKNDLLAIYIDYLRFSRAVENMVHSYTPRQLAYSQLSQLFDGKITKDTKIPWRFELINQHQSRIYQDFVNDETHWDSRYSYISLRYTDNRQDAATRQCHYVPDGYLRTAMRLDLPTPVEMYQVIYPQDELMKNAVFLVDNRFAVTYKHPEHGEMKVRDAFARRDVCTEFRVLMNLLDYFTHNPYLEDKAYPRELTNILASEDMQPYENMLLEALGSFADKLKDICKQLFNNRTDKDFFKYAEKDGLISSSADMQDYVNIRNLMRHQWDTYAELGEFQADKAALNAAIRQERLDSYRRVCVPALTERVRNYIKILHQFREVVKIFHPNLVVRESDESNSKFVERLKKRRAENPQAKLLIETNYAKSNEKFAALTRNIGKIWPDAQIIDNVANDGQIIKDLIEDYYRRGDFLRTYHDAECNVMIYSLNFGHNFGRIDAWNYAQRRKIVNYNEAQQWQKYTALRHDLSHNYYNQTLREQVKQKLDDFDKLYATLFDKLEAQAPETRLVSPNVYKIVHKNGLEVDIDYNTYKITTNRSNTRFEQKQPAVTKQQNVEAAQGHNRTHKEEFANGMLITHDGEQIIECRLPNGVFFNLPKQRISLPQGEKLLFNAEDFNVLQSDYCKIFTDKNMYVTRALARGRLTEIGRNDMLLFGTMKVATDNRGRISNINVKIAGDSRLQLKTDFANQRVSFNLSDGTVVQPTAQSLKITHNGQVLTYANRRAFVDTYNTQPPINTNKNSGR